MKISFILSVIISCLSLCTSLIKSSADSFRSCSVVCLWFSSNSITSQFIIFIDVVWAIASSSLRHFSTLFDNVLTSKAFENLKPCCCFIPISFGIFSKLSSNWRWLKFERTFSIFCCRSLSLWWFGRLVSINLEDAASSWETTVSKALFRQKLKSFRARSNSDWALVEGLRSVLSSSSRTKHCWSMTCCHSFSPVLPTLRLDRLKTSIVISRCLTRLCSFSVCSLCC